ncbi:MAG: radical SAM protein [Bacilli bacterium]|nr:radical SAM protein [Bacilli bacterium]
MILDNLYLEITRDCTIECEHCLRGEKEHKNMSVTTLENVLKNIKKIGTLLLSGGEPLINIQLLEALPHLIEKYNIDVNRIGIITNGTVYSERHVDALNGLKGCCNELDFVLSSDLFHRLEWQRLGVEELVERNFDRYNESVGIRKYLSNDINQCVVLFRKGRALKISSERLAEIKRKHHIEYKFGVEEQERVIRFGNMVEGKLYINVDGYLVNYNLSFKEEDRVINNYSINGYSLTELIDNQGNQKKLGTY